MIGSYVQKPDLHKRSSVALVPSNIAFLKYWGKQDEVLQWPANDSLSMTLKNACTVTKAQRSEAPHDRIFADGQFQDPMTSPFKKGYLHLRRLREHTQSTGFLDIFTENTFPKGCGIASSASGLGALTLAALASWTQAVSLEDLESKGFDRVRLAHLARLGSGSATRSFWGGYVVWEKGLSPETQRTYPLAIPEHLKLADLIVLVSREPKEISSTEGHQRAWSSPLFRPRLAIHPFRMQEMIKALSEGNVEKLGDMIETEALDMHAVMMTAETPIHYLNQTSCELITWIRQERLKGNLPAWFTIDAGPNIHVICAQKDQSAVHNALLTRFESKRPIELFIDETGQGPLLNVE